MSFIQVQFQPPKSRKKEIQIISLEQVVGKHIKLPTTLNIVKEFHTLAEKYEHVKVMQNTKEFTVLSPNRENITFGSNGMTARWTLVAAMKDTNKMLVMLLIGHTLWGIQVDLGIKLKHALRKYENEKIEKYLLNQFYSVMKEPETWDLILVYN